MGSKWPPDHLPRNFDGFPFLYPRITFPHRHANIELKQVRNAFLHRVSKLNHSAPWGNGRYHGPLLGNHPRLFVHAITVNGTPISIISNAAGIHFFMACGLQATPVCTVLIRSIFLAGNWNPRCTILQGTLPKFRLCDR